MEKEFVPYQPSLDMKELGFDEPCLVYYNGYKELDHLMPERVVVGKNYNGETTTSAPLYQQAFRWFREKYGYLHHITYFDSVKAQIPGNADYQGFVLFPYGEIHKLPKMSYDTYEEAELACLIKLIEIVKDGKNTNS